jgi:hypothetical protein
MREIKFRGKTVSTKEWVYGDLVHNAFDGHRIFPVGIQIPGCYPDEVIAETVGQFTGLHDKNGKEIYEGDLIKYGSDAPLEVIYRESCFCYNQKSRYISRLQIFDNINKIEVIGKIYER